MATGSSNGSQTTRLEAFSDGVFAIAITLLVLEIHVPSGEGSLLHRLGSQWLVYVTFVVSFVVIGIMWLNHHEMFRVIRTVDHGVVVANLFLLLTVSFLPFPTKVMGEELGGTNFADRQTAAVFYASSFVAVTIAFNALWWQATRQQRHVGPDIQKATLTARTRRYALGIPAYGAVRQSQRSTQTRALSPVARLRSCTCYLTK